MLNSTEKLFSNQNIMARQIYKKKKKNAIEGYGMQSSKKGPGHAQSRQQSAWLIARVWREAPDKHPGVSDRAQIVRMPRNCLGDPTGV